MDRQHFDELARALARGRLPRRGALRVLGSSALASFGVAALVDARGQAQGDGHARSQADRNRRTRQFQCRPSGIKCKLKKASSPRGLCKNCCETFQKRSKTTGRCCTPNGRPCSSAAECCLGVCSVGLCQNEVIQLPPPCRPYGQPCAVATDCCRYSDGTHIPCSGGFCRED
jgi:hypothetical protein